MQAPDQIQRVVVFRPPEYTMGPQAVPEIAESCLNRYRMKIEPLSFDEQRASFQIRAPGLGVVASSNVFIESSWTIKCPSRYNMASVMSALVSKFDNKPIEAVGAGGGVAEVAAVGYAPKIAFGGGDAMVGAASNIQLTVNGATLANSRQRDYTNALDRVWFSDSVFQRRFSCAGGLPDQHDSICLSGMTTAAVNAATKVSGFTADSGIEKRCENLISCTEEILDANNDQDFRRVRIRWPVRACGILSPVGPFDSQADSSPFRNTAIAIPHFNTVSLDILWVGLKECIFRNLTARQNTQTDPAGTLANQDRRGGFEVKLDKISNPPQLHVEYLRLGLWNQIPASISLSAYKIAIHDPIGTPVCQGLSGAANNYLETTGIQSALTRTSVNRNLAPALPAVGTARTNGGGRCAAFSGDRYMTARFQVTSAQVASYLFFVLQKSSDVYVLGGDNTVPEGRLQDSIGKQISNWDYAPGALGGGANTSTVNAGLHNYFLARNTNACASIQQFELEVMSSVGSYKYSTEKYPFIRGRHELFRDVLRHTCPNYLKGDINTWRKHCCIVLLSSSDFIRGLTTQGASFPVQYSVKVRYASEREYINGCGAVAAGDSTGYAVLRDCIYGRPIMGEIFDKAELRLSPSSGLVSSMNISHQTAMDLVSRGGARTAIGGGGGGGQLAIGGGAVDVD